MGFAWQRNYPCGMVVFTDSVTYMRVTASFPLYCMSKGRILEASSSFPGLWTEQKRNTKAMGMGNGFQVLSSSALLAHTTVLWFVPYHIHFHGPTSKWQDAFSINQLNFNQNIIKGFTFNFWKSASLYQQIWVARQGVSKIRGAGHWSLLRTRDSPKIASVIFITPKPHSTYQSVLRDHGITYHVSRTHGCVVLKNSGLISYIFGDVWPSTELSWWNVTDRENLKYNEIKVCPSANFYTTNPTWCDLRLTQGSGLRGSRLISQPRHGQWYVLENERQKGFPLGSCLIYSSRPIIRVQSMGPTVWNLKVHVWTVGNLYAN
jgi:hypothetical protein